MDQCSPHLPIIRLADVKKSAVAALSSGQHGGQGNGGEEVLARASGGDSWPD